jgi:hypothetical protein
MSRKNDGKPKCPFCWRENGKKVFIVKPSRVLELGAYCPDCSVEVVEDSGKLYIKRPGSKERIPYLRTH